jgi:serine/threonine-protein kinase
MAQVHLAVARGLGGFNKLVVLKRLESSEESFRTMFLDEARLAARLQHPNVVHTYEVSETAGSYHIAMEYLDGQPLDKIVREARKLGQPLEARWCARVLADALSGLPKYRARTRRAAWRSSRADRARPSATWRAALATSA